MPIRVGGIIAAVMVALGAFLPWATVSFFGSVSGIDGDGKFTLVCAIAIGVMFGLWKRPALIVAVVLAGITLIVGILDLIDLGRASSDFGGFAGVSPGIGLFLTVLAAIAALVLGLMGLAAVGKAPAAFGAPAYGAASYGGATAYGAATAYPQAGPATAYPTATAYPPAGPAVAYPAAAAYPPAQQAVPQAAPAGWQPDPYGQAQWRYWDGTRWTEHVQ